MPTLISGTLIDGVGQPVHNGQIFLTALKTSATVVSSVVATITPADSGQYSMNVESGIYNVQLFIDTRPPQTVGTIEVRDNSAPGTLNDFLTRPTAGDITNDVMARFEALAKAVQDNANTSAQSAQRAESAETSADKSKDAADVSAAQAAESLRGAITAETNAGKSADAAAVSAQAAKTSETHAANSELAAASSAEQAALSQKGATDSAQEAKSAEANAKGSEAAAAQSLKEAQEIAKTPGPSAYDVWKANQPVGADTSQTAYFTAIKGPKGDDGPSAYEVWKSVQPAETDTSQAAYLDAIKGEKGERGEAGAGGGAIPYGDIGSYVLAFVYSNNMDDNYLKNGVISGSALSVVSAQGGPYGLDFSTAQNKTPLTGTWQAMCDSGFSQEVTGGQFFLFQRMR